MCVFREMEIRLLQLIVGDCYRPMVACCPLLIGPLFVLAEDFPYSEILQIRIGGSTQVYRVWMDSIFSMFDLCVVG